ncbi:VOC family protein [Rhizobium etli]|uniref:Putative enzyme related to lactoylglutathione lyase n=1 Tax=Rhizobium etli TaxID=29449 RepID=A0A7W6Y8K9_RHIET|nr:VOC family protein [Rhizobium etli]MBB4481299.1 putative enzyme related to lactoylglutathione lyase [Rhizobium etli]MBB4537088.1 putative enzyme related to lactoylglutathione lyase [Rhizobium etli]
MQLRLELFVEAPEISLDFYRRVLGFAVQGTATAEYTILSNGDAVIAISSRSALSSDRPLRMKSDERVGHGVEIVLSVNDIEDAYRTAKASSWPISVLARRPWGLPDFRLIEPDGHYVRMTSDHTS